MEDKNVGKTFGIYTILSVHKNKDKDGHALYNCRCNTCNGLFVRRLYYIKHTKECHHTNLSWINRRIGQIYANMKNRCYNTDRKDYCWYGKKGICICDEWLENPLLFEEWSLNNGYGDDLTIDRIESDKDYCPENCRWIPMVENSRRAGVVRWITVDNTTLTGRQWADKLHIGTNIINTCVREHGIDKTIELIAAMLKDPPANKKRMPTQSWFSVYGISIDND